MVRFYFRFILAFLVFLQLLPDIPPGLAEPIFSRPPLKSATKDYSDQISLQKISVPREMGKIQARYQGPQKKIVLFIHDVHASEEGQINIARILDFFSAHYGLELVGLEGAEGDLNTRIFSFTPQKKALQDISDYFLKKKRLSGAEYLALVKRPDLKLRGIENRRVYDKNRKVYLDALKVRERNGKILDEYEKILEDLSSYVFSQEFLKFNRMKSDFQLGKLELPNYLRGLVKIAKQKKISIQDYSAIRRLSEVEERFDFGKAEAQIDELIDFLGREISRSRSSRFSTNRMLFRTNKMEKSAFYAYLENEIRVLMVDQPRENLMTRDFSDVLGYLNFFKLYGLLKVKVLSELTEFEKKIKRKTVRSEEEEKLDRVFRIFEVLKRMLSFTAAKEDLDFFYLNRREFLSSSLRDILTPLFERHQFQLSFPSESELLDQDMLYAEQFYELALKRDRIFVENISAEMTRTDKTVAALVAGGFHAPGIENKLREEGFSYLVIEPMVNKTKKSKSETRLYEDALAQNPMEIETGLTQAFFPVQTSAPPILHQWLSPWLTVQNSFENAPPHSRLYFLQILWASILNYDDLSLAESDFMRSLPEGLPENLAKILADILSGVLLTPSSAEGLSTVPVGAKLLIYQLPDGEFGLSGKHPVGEKLSDEYKAWLTPAGLVSFQQSETVLFFGRLNPDQIPESLRQKIAKNKMRAQTILWNIKKGLV